MVTAAGKIDLPIIISCLMNNMLYSKSYGKDNQNNSISVMQIVLYYLCYVEPIFCHFGVL